MENKYEGRCHCGSVSFRLVADLDHCFKCNCSFCSRRGTTLIKVDEPQFFLETNEDLMRSYGSREFADHYFCKNCGIHCYTRFNSTKGIGINVNVGCLDGVDIFALNPTLFDGANKL